MLIPCHSYSAYPHPGVCMSPSTKASRLRLCTKCRVPEGAPSPASVELLVACYNRRVHLRLIYGTHSLAAKPGIQGFEVIMASPKKEPSKPCS